MYLCLLFSSIDQLSEVVHHNIEAAVKLQNDMVLVCNGIF